MKDFMMIFIGSDYAQLNLSPEQMQARMGQWFAWNQKMQTQGVLRGGHALHPDVKRVVGADRTITNSTAAEVKELIGGYYIVNAASYDDVVKIAQDYPDYDLGGTVEIREVMVFEQ